jgi:hypothetical protein
MSIPLFSLLGRANGTDADHGAYIPLPNTRSRKPRVNVLRLARNGYSSCFSLALAVLAGILIGFCLSPFNRPPRYGHPPPRDPPNENTLSIPPSAIAIPDTEYLSVETLRNTVARTKGYWARDYSLHLGWNNVSDRPSCIIMCLTFLR